jgi:hypothetical protein
MDKLKKYFQEREKNKQHNNNERGWICCRVSELNFFFLVLVWLRSIFKANKNAGRSLDPGP